MIKILVAEDDPDSLDQLRWAVQDTGREVFSADNASEAIRLIQEHNFAVVVTDLRMETKDAGLRILQAAKTKNLQCQIILVTAYGTPEISVKTMRMGAFDYLERNAPGSNFLIMVREKVRLALDFRKAQRAEKEHNAQT